MEPENLQSVLQEAGIQVDMKNLQNPTEEFMIYLITEYFNKFNFDANEISKSTIEQLDCLSSPDSALDAIKAINLFSALSSICNEIFLKDLCLTDITSPGPKRARRQIKILFNFFAYVRNKMSENEMAFEELDNQKKHIEEMIDKKNSTIAKTGAIIRDRENKLELKQQLQQEIDHICLDIENNNKKSQQLENQVKDVMMKHQEVSKKCNDFKSKALKLHQITTELQSKIVKSPEEYAARSKELNKLLEIKKKERQELTDSITKKKVQIKNNENARELVRDVNEKFLINTSETCTQLRETTKQLEYLHKKSNLLKEEIEKWISIKKNQTTSFDDTDLKGHEQFLLELDNQYTQKEREIISQEDHLKKLKNEIDNKKSKLENYLKIISITERENYNIMNQYKEDFTIHKNLELSLREDIENTISRSVKSI